MVTTNASLKWEKDAYAGQRCFIIGTGASIMAEDLRPLADEFTMGCNGLFLWKGLPFTPTVYCMIDHPAFGMWHKQIEQLDTYRVAGLRQLDTWPKEDISNWHVIEQRRDMAVYDGYWNGYLPDFTWCAGRSNVVWSLSAQLAFWLGFGEVFMLGVDGGRRGHCYDYMDYLSGNKDIGSAIPGKGDLHIRKTVIESVKHFEDAGRKIINLNPLSKTGWEPYNVTLKEVLK